MFCGELGETGAAYCTVCLYVFFPCFHNQTVVPLPGVCSHHLGNKTRMGAERVEHVDDLSAVALLLAGYVEKHVALFQRAERRVYGFPVGAAAGGLCQLVAYRYEQPIGRRWLLEAGPLGGGWKVRNVLPSVESLPHLSAVLRSREEVASRTEVLRERSIRGEEPLGVSG
jgi:hypothetical protein